MSLALAEPATAPHAVLEAEDTGVFRVLQLADFHSDVDENMNARTRQDVRAMIDRFRPHLLAVTGDIWCGEEHPDAAPMWMRRDLDFLGSLGVPWAFAWGNHDGAADFDAAWRQIADTPHAIAPHGDGRGGFRIALKAADGLPLWDMFFLNSGPRWNLPDDLAWFDAEIRRLDATRERPLPLLVFFHIPLKCYQTAVDERRAAGLAYEEVLFWGDEAGTGADVFKRAAETRPVACFCAHSHRNDFHFEEDGVLFAYGRATGYGGYGNEDVPKGGTLVEIDFTKGRLTHRAVFADGSCWIPEAGCLIL